MIPGPGIDWRTVELSGEEVHQIPEWMAADLIVAALLAQAGSDPELDTEIRQRKVLFHCLAKIGCDNGLVLEALTRLRREVTP